MLLPNTDVLPQIWHFAGTGILLACQVRSRDGIAASRTAPARIEAP